MKNLDKSYFDCPTIAKPETVSGNTNQEQVNNHMRSGKQILLYLLTKYSQEFQKESSIEIVSDRVKSGILVLCSTAQFMFEYIDKYEWITQNHIVEDKDFGPERQGLGLKNQKLLLSDLFALITEDETKIPKNIKRIYPNINIEDYKAGVHLIWSLLRALEWSVNFEGIESEKSDLQKAEETINNYLKILKTYRKNPEDYF
ncbi:hypothetical protein [Elizabethkingia anophelis]|uniref:hypothetical protein n=1 Tax=Elizabethkingia anophelis TaxID=1117645 RepID=UPI00301CF3AE